MIYENKCEDGETITIERRLERLNEIKTSYNNLNYNMSIRSIKDRWLTIIKKIRDVGSYGMKKKHLWKEIEEAGQEKKIELDH